MLQPVRCYFSETEAALVMVHLMNSNHKLIVGRGRNRHSCLELLLGPRAPTHSADASE